MKLSETLEFIEIIDDNVKILITKRNLKKEPEYFSLKQIHSDKFHFISSRNSSINTLEGDGIITDIRDFPIGIRTADCLGIFIYSKINEVIGVAHCGWRSTAKRLIEKMIEFLLNEINLNKEEINFVLSHSICKNCYEVKDDMKDIFLKEFGEEGEKFFEKINKNKYLFDLKSANIELIKKFEIKNDQIFDLKKCTICNNNDYYSFRKEKTKQRNLNIIVINGGM